MAFLRALFVFKHHPSTVQSYFLMLLLLMANPFQFSENYFLVLSICIISTQVCWHVTCSSCTPSPIKGPYVELNQKHTVLALEGSLEFIKTNSNLCISLPYQG